MKYLSLAKRMIKIRLSNAFAYKADFFTIIFAKIIGDLVGPLLALFIYQSTLGIPGWTFEQFILFQGTFILVLGLSVSISADIFWHVFGAIDSGTFDKYLLKPYNSWLFLMALSTNWEGFAEISLGIILITYSIIKLDIAITSIAFIIYLSLIMMGVLFFTSAYTILAAGSIVAVRNEALLNLFHRMLDFARYPLDVYSSAIKFSLTFLFPLAVGSFYPATVLIHGGAGNLAALYLPTIGFFIASLAIWHYSIKKHNSAGG